jgi:hypothetical protein
MADGSFSEPARAAIYEAGDGRCVGCGSGQVTAQHRQARGMGGTSRDAIAYAVNGLPLCGSGTTGCHGWAEHHPILAELLGWRTSDWRAPWWSRFGWRRWVMVDLYPATSYVDPIELDRPVQRAAAEDVARRAVI